MGKITIFWHRRDLRLDDNAGLYHALRNGSPVLPLFIFDTNILEELEDRSDPRVTFIYDQILDVKGRLESIGSSMLIRYGDPVEVWSSLIGSLDISAVFTNRDFEPYAVERDDRVRSLLQQHGIAFHTYKDHVIFEKGEVLKKDGSPYTVFTPFSRRWKEKLDSRSVVAKEKGETRKTSFYLRSYPSEAYTDNFFQTDPTDMPALSGIGFQRSPVYIPPRTVSRELIRKYDKTRDIPSLRGTSRLGIHFRFGTISIREKARRAERLNQVYLNELIWRDFYSQILANFPHVATRAFRPEYDFIEWRNDEGEFHRWCEGKTGYPIVDAGMRELNASGWMHNRVRMITASFLSKHLLIDWRWGEAYFASKLLDFELASNNGGWQWAAGSGTDAAPYFRIFNPISQQQKFDKDFRYVRKWVPEFGTPAYPEPMVDHKAARERCLKVYKTGLEKGRAAAW